jgi:predicted amidohydrolase
LKDLTMDSFKLALVQMHVDGGDRQRNLARAGDMIARAVGTGAQYALLPEGQQ